MQETNNIKAQFIVNYWNQQVLCWEGQTSSRKGMMVGSKNMSEIDETYYLQLRSLESITDEEAETVAKISGFEKRSFRICITLLEISTRELMTVEENDAVFKDLTANWRVLSQEDIDRKEPRIEFIKSRIIHHKKLETKSISK